MIEYTDVLSVGYLKKQTFTGSDRGMRYLIRRTEEGLEAYVWPQPMNFEHTAEDRKTKADFPYSEEGRRQAIDWLNRVSEERRQEWDAAGFTV